MANDVELDAANGMTTTAWLPSVRRFAVRLCRRFLFLRSTPVEARSNRDRGRLGEQRAVERLRSDGCRILGRNRRVAGVEIDVLAFDEDRKTILVVEVKSSIDGRPPERRVDVGRRRRLVRAAEHLGRRRPVEIEVIAVDLRDRRPDSIRRIRLEPGDCHPARGQRGR